MQSRLLLFVLLLANCVGLQAKVVINEVMFFEDVGSAEVFKTYQWVELYNPDTNSVNLNDWVITNSDETKTIQLPNWNLEGQSYLVVHFTNGTNDSDFSDNAGHYYTGPNTFFSNSVDDCALYNDTPNISSIVDFVCWQNQTSYFTSQVHDYAVQANIWSNGDVFFADGSNALFSKKTPSVQPGESIGRDMNSKDLNVSTDWFSSGGKDAIDITIAYRNYSPLTIGFYYDPTTMPNKEWTIMLYGVGDQDVDMEQWIFSDLNEIEQSGGTDNNVNFVLQYDGLNKVSFNDQSGVNIPNSTGQTCRGFLKSDTTKNLVKLHTLAGQNPLLGEVNMGNAFAQNSLIDFVNWSKANFPAKNYMLILGSHGSGWRGIAEDTTNTDDGLLMDEFKAMHGVLSKVDIIGFDACLMGMVEVAKQVQPLTDYMVASEEVIPGDGFPYLQFCNFLKGTPTTLPANLSSKLVDLYTAKYPHEPKHTLSAVDLSHPDFNDLINDISDFGADLINLCDDYLTKADSTDNGNLLLKNTIDGIVRHFHFYNYKDLYDLCLKIEQNSAIPLTYKSKINNIKNHLLNGGNIIINEKHGNFGTPPFGLSIYLPLSQSTIISDPFDKTYPSHHNISYKYSYDPDDCNPQDLELAVDPNAINHPFPPMPGFDFVTQTQWDEFLHRFYEPCADASTSTGRTIFETNEIIDLTGEGSSDIDEGTERFFWDKDDLIDSFTGCCGADKTNPDDNTDKNCLEDLDDEKDAEGEQVQISYPNSGVYNITLTVWDKHHLLDSLNSEHSHKEHYETDQDKLTVFVVDCPEDVHICVPNGSEEPVYVDIPPLIDPNLGLIINNDFNGTDDASDLYPVGITPVFYSIYNPATGEYFYCDFIVNIDNNWQEPLPIDVSIIKQVSNPTPEFGDLISYQLIVQNEGPGIATNIQVQEILPLGVFYIDHFSSANGVYDPASSLWIINQLMPGETATLDINVQVDITEGEVVNTAEIIAHNEIDIDSIPGNGNEDEDDFSSVVFQVGCIFIDLFIPNLQYCVNELPTTFDAPDGFVSYQWSTGETSQTIQISAAGTYSLTVYDENGCSATTSFTVTILDNLVLPTQQVFTCEDGFPVEICMQNPETIMTGVWQDGSGTICINVNAAGTYAYSYLNLDLCEVSGAIEVIIEAPQLELDDLTLCEAELPFALTATDGFVSYTWSTGTTSSTLNITQTGSYALTATDANGCSVTASFVVTVEDCTDPCENSPVVTVNDVELCADDLPATLTATSPGGTFQWSNGSTSQSITVSTAGTYTVTVMDANGCDAMASATVTINPEPTISLQDVEICADNAPAIINGPAGFVSYTWSTGETTQNISVTTSGTYTITVFDENGCHVSASTTVIISPEPSISLQDIEICADFAPATINGPAGFVSYTWSTGETTQNISVTTSGTYTVTVTDANGCSASASAVITIIDCPDPCENAEDVFEIAEICEGESYTAYTGTVYTQSGSEIVVDENGCAFTVFVELVILDTENFCAENTVSIDLQGPFCYDSLMVEIISIYTCGDGTANPCFSFEYIVSVNDIIIGIETPENVQDLIGNYEGNELCLQSISYANSDDLTQLLTSSVGTPVVDLTALLEAEFSVAIGDVICFGNYLCIFGCTDPMAINYNPEATINDGSCEYKEDPCPEGTLEYTIIIYASNSTSPTEISWSFDDEEGNVIADAPCGYYDGSSDDIYAICLSDTTAYYFYAYDDYGNGWNGASVQIYQEETLIFESFPDNEIEGDNIAGCGESDLENSNRILGDTVETAVCGDGVCELGENADNCPDCVVQCNLFLEDIIECTGGFYQVIVAFVEGESYLVTNNISGEVTSLDTSPFMSEFMLNGSDYSYTFTLVGQEECSEAFSASNVCDNPTSVELISFGGEALGDKNRLYWLVASEYNTDYYIVEKSLNGQNFEAIGNVMADNRTSTVSSYNFIDENVQPENYYRLLEVDADGNKSIVSDVILLKALLDEMSVKVFPVPTRDQLNVDFEITKASAVLIEVVNIHGQQLFAQKLEAVQGINALSIDVSDFTSGVYFLNISTNEQAVSQRFVKE